MYALCREQIAVILQLDLMTLVAVKKESWTRPKAGNSEWIHFHLHSMLYDHWGIHDCRALSDLCRDRQGRPIIAVRLRRPTIATWLKEQPSASASLPA